MYAGVPTCLAVDICVCIHLDACVDGQLRGYRRACVRLEQSLHLRALRGLDRLTSKYGAVLAQIDTPTESQTEIERDGVFIFFMVSYTEMSGISSRDDSSLAHSQRPRFLFLRVDRVFLSTFRCRSLSFFFQEMEEEEEPKSLLLKKKKKNKKLTEEVLVSEEAAA